jgi:hypothetical protein
MLGVGGGVTSALTVATGDAVDSGVGVSVEVNVGVGERIGVEVVVGVGVFVGVDFSVGVADGICGDKVGAGEAVSEGGGSPGPICTVLAPATAA